jgi:hypothetical protein
VSPFWRALLVGLVLVAVVLFAEGYGRTLRSLASAAQPGRHPRFGWRDVRGIQWLMAIGASLLGAAVLLAILVTALPAPQNGVPDATAEAAAGSAGRSSNETPYPAQEPPQDSNRVALAKAEARESRHREQRVDQ